MTETNSSLNDSCLCVICYTNPYDFVCSSCKTKMCHECIKHYITTYSNLEPHCMNCNTALPFPVIYNSLGKAGIVKFFNDSAELKFQLERQKIPDCLDCCNKVIKIKSLRIVPSVVQKVLIDLSHMNISEVSNPELFHIINSSFVDESAFNYNLSILRVIQKLVQHHPFYIETDTNNDDNTTNNESSKIRTKHKDLLHLDKAKTLKHIIEYDLNNNRQYKLNPFWKSEEVIQYFMNININKGPLDISNAIKFRKQLINEYKLITDVKYETFEGLSDIVYNINNTNNEPIYSIITKYERTNRNKDLGTSKKSMYLFRCSNGECKGFVQASDWMCQLCNHVYCQKCFKDITDNNEQHVCDSADVESAKLILESTKPCPKCAARIFKISGCSQMFCTNCHVGFDWNTGKLITTEFHNPHRLEWLNSQLQNNGTDDMDCMEPYDILTRGLYSTYGETNKLISLNIEFERRKSQYFHFRNSVLPGWRAKLNDIGRFDYRNRCLFVLNMINEQEYKDYLASQIKNEHKYRLLIRIYEDFVNTLGDVLVIILQEFHVFLTKLYNNENCDALIRCWNRLIENNIETSTITEAIDKYKIDSNFKDWIVRTLPVIWRSYPNIKYKELCIFKEMPTFSKVNEVLNLITNDTAKSLKSYCEMFKISQITTPTNYDPNSKYTYYKVK